MSTQVASTLIGSGHTETAAHPSASKRSLHVRRHGSHMHIYSWSGKGFTAGSYCPDKGVRSGSMSALPALTVLTAALLRSASEWSISLHPDLNAVMNPQAAPQWELARHAAIVAQRRGVLYQLVVDGWMLRIFSTSGERPKRDCRRSATEGRLRTVELLFYPGLPGARTSFSVYVALTNIPVGELLTGFAMRSDPNVVFG